MTRTKDISLIQDLTFNHTDVRFRQSILAGVYTDQAIMDQYWSKMFKYYNLDFSTTLDVPPDKLVCYHPKKKINMSKKLYLTLYSFQVFCKLVWTALTTINLPTEEILNYFIIGSLVSYTQRNGLYTKLSTEDWW